MHDCCKQTYIFVYNFHYCLTLLIKVPKPLESKYQHVKSVFWASISMKYCSLFYFYVWNGMPEKNISMGFSVYPYMSHNSIYIIYIYIYIYTYSAGANLEHIVDMAHQTICRWPKPERFQAIIYVVRTGYCVSLNTVSSIRYYSTSIR